MALDQCVLRQGPRPALPLCAAQPIGDIEKSFFLAIISALSPPSWNAETPAPPFFQQGLARSAQYTATWSGEGPEQRIRITAGIRTQAVRLHCP